MLRVLLFAFFLLGTLSLTSGSAAQTPAPKIAETLRRLLPLPEGTLDPKTEITMGLSFSPDRGYTLFRQSSDYASQIVAVRRTLTGGIADAPRWRRLGNLYRAAGLRGKASTAFRRSEALCQNALRRNPRNGFAIAEYGCTLQEAGEIAASEKYLQKAARTAPNSPDVWLALGSVLQEEASPKTEAVKHYARNAGAAYDRAVSLAPRDPIVWITRGDFRTWGLPQAHGKISSRDGLSDYARAAVLTPYDPYAQAQVATIDCFTFELAHQMFTSRKAAKMEPAASDHRAEDILRRITKIGRSTRGRKSAEAYAARAWVQFEFFYDATGAQKSLRLALAQHPAEQDAIDYQMHVAAVSGNYPLLAAVCRRELKRRPEVRLRVLLAEADYYLAQQKPKYWQEGLAQMELAHAAQPDDYACALGLAVFLLKGGQTPRADLLLTEIAPKAQQRPKEQQAEYDVMRGISAALAGRQEEARKSLGKALKINPQNKAAKSALALPAN